MGRVRLRVARRKIISRAPFSRAGSSGKLYPSFSSQTGMKKTFFFQVKLRERDCENIFSNTQLLGATDWSTHSSTEKFLSCVLDFHFTSNENKFPPQPRSFSAYFPVIVWMNDFVAKRKNWTDSSRKRTATVKCSPDLRHSFRFDLVFLRSSERERSEHFLRRISLPAHSGARSTFSSATNTNKGGV